MVPYEGITGDRESENKSYRRLHLKRTALKLFVNTSINGKRLITHVIHLFNAFSIHRVRTCQEECNSRTFQGHVSGNSRTNGLKKKTLESNKKSRKNC